MCCKLVHRWSCRCFFRKCFHDEICWKCRQPDRKFWLLKHDGLDTTLARGHAKWRAAHKKFICKHATGPSINFAVIPELEIILVLIWSAFVRAKYHLHTYWSQMTKRPSQGASFLLEIYKSFGFLRTQHRQIPRHSKLQHDKFVPFKRSNRCSRLNPPYTSQYLCILHIGIRNSI